MKLLCLSLFAAALFAAPDIQTIRTPNNGIQPRAILDRSGTLHLLYYLGDHLHGDLFYVKSSDLGATWSSPLRVNSEPGTAIAAGTIRGGEMAIGKNGRVHVAWNGSSNAAPSGPLNPESGQRGAPMLYSRLNDSHTGFEPERNLMTRTFGLDGGGVVAADLAGHVYVSWHGKTPGAAKGEAGRQVWIAESDNNGKTFAVERPAWNQPTGACGCCGMAIFADSKGVVRALYRSATENVHRDIYLLTAPRGSRVFEGRKLDTWNINACPMSSMDFAQAGDKVEGAWETGGHVYFEDLTAANAVRIAAPEGGQNQKHPRLAIAPDGETLMAWTEGTGWNRGGSLAWQLYDAPGKPLGKKCAQPGVPAWSFGAVVAKPHGGFLVLY